MLYETWKLLVSFMTTVVVVEEGVSGFLFSVVGSYGMLLISGIVDVDPFGFRGSIPKLLLLVAVHVSNSPKHLLRTL